MADAHSAPDSRPIPGSAIGSPSQVPDARRLESELLERLSGTEDGSWVREAIRMVVALAVRLGIPSDPDALARACELAVSLADDPDVFSRVSRKVRMLIAGPGDALADPMARQRVSDAAVLALLLVDGEHAARVLARLWRGESHPAVARARGETEAEAGQRYLVAMRAWRDAALGLLNGRGS